MPNKAELVEVVAIIASLVRSVHMKRALAEVDQDPRLNFWRLIHGQLMDFAVLEWCKLFGSDDAEHQLIHWKNVVPQDEHDDFRAGLFRRLGIGEQ
jgi:hypothetical protein